jgi:hypothetical protein
MARVRRLLFAGCLGMLLLSACSVEWEARLEHGNAAWSMNLGRHPVWHAPPLPDYAAFRESFRGSDPFPGPLDPWRIRGDCHVHLWCYQTVLLAWPFLFGCGLRYYLEERTPRDVFLECAFHGAIGAVTGVVAVIGTWLLVGGWGPPCVGCCDVGFGLGIVSGLMTYAFEERESVPSRGVRSDRNT